MMNNQMSQIKIFEYTDADGDDVTLTVNLQLLEAKAIGTLYDYKGEVKSKNKNLGTWRATDKKKFINVLKNCIGNMGESTKQRYEDFISSLLGGE